MLEVIILAIFTFFVILKLKSILGEEHDKLYFDYKNQEFKTVKDADQLNFDESLNENFPNLTNEAKIYAKEISNKIDNFDLNKFKSIATKVLECVIKANDEQNKDDIKKFLSKELAELVCSSFSDEETNHIILVALNEAKICDILRNGFVYDIVLIFKMEQINYTTDKDNNVIDGSKSEVVNVKERWYFSHDFAKKDSTWFVRKIEEL